MRSSACATLPAPPVMRVTSKASKASRYQSMAAAAPSTIR